MADTAPVQPAPEPEDDEPQQASVTLFPKQMNFLYAGISNPLEIFDGGHADASLQLSTDNGRIARTQSGWTLSGAHSGQATVTIKAGGQTVEKASEMLYEAMDRIMDGDLDDDLPDMEGLEGLMGGEDTAEAQQIAMAMQMQQKAYQAMAGEEMQQLQQQMAQAMMRGDMEEYTRLVAEIQRKAMGL